MLFICIPELFVIEEEESNDTNTVEESKHFGVNNAQFARPAGATVAEEPIAAVVMPLTCSTDHQASQQQNDEKMDFATNIDESKMYLTSYCILHAHV